jgi:hypothetical protein
MFKLIMIAARIGIKYGNPDESNQSFHFITAKDIPAMVILTVAFNPIFFAVCIPTINCSPPSTKRISKRWQRRLVPSWYHSYHRTLIVWYFKNEQMQ